jgi:hypothetical protein
VTDYHVYEPVETGIEVVRAALVATPSAERDDFFNERWFDLLAGTSELRRTISSSF